MTYIRAISTTSRYARGLRFFHINSNVNEVISSFFINYTNEYLTNKRNRIRVLDIGCGDGSISRCFASTLNQKFSLIKYHLIEPNIKSLNKAINSIKLVLDDKHICSQPTTVQAFISSICVKPCYDFILASHSLYFVESEYYKKIIELLKDDGVFIVILDRLSNPLIKFTDIISKVDSLCAERFLESLLSKNDNSYFINTLDLIAELKLPKYFNLDSPTDDTKNIISFLFQKNFDHFSNDEWLNVKKSLSDALPNNIATLPMQAILIKKQEVL